VTKKVWPPLLLTVWPKVSAKSLDQAAKSHKSLNNHNQSRHATSLDNLMESLEPLHRV
jgi:hypothetical protein